MNLPQNITQKNGIAIKKTAEQSLLRYTGTPKNIAAVMRFCGEESIKYTDSGQMCIRAPEGNAELKPGMFVINGMKDEFYTSSSESAHANYFLDEIEIGDDPILVMSRPKTIYFHTFNASNVQESVNFVASNNLKGNTLKIVSEYGPYNLSRPNNEDYSLVDGDILAFSGKRIYPIKPNAFERGYDVYRQIGMEYGNSCTSRIFQKDVAEGIPTSFKIETSPFNFVDIDYQNGTQDIALMIITLARLRALMNIKRNDQIVERLHTMMEMTLAGLQKYGAIIE